ncbi:MAG: type 4a pilus biogenesis protein PilO [Actinomycetota bacterium]|nr:type 4a pilus biogenesis protein PilO [Actinomycetota bacterium]
MNRRAPLIAAILVALLAILAVVFLVLPKMSDVDEAERRLDDAKAEELTLQAELSRLQEAEEDAGQLRRELARFRRAIPPVADLPGLINQLQTAADVAGVDFFAISPGIPAAAEAGQASEIPTQIQVIGGFFPVDAFLAELETIQRASKAVSITVAIGPDGAPQIDVQMDVRFYTTDLEAGPGAAPVAAPGTQTGPAASPSPTASPGASPAPGESPAPVTTPTPGG